MWAAICRVDGTAREPKFRRRCLILGASKQPTRCHQHVDYRRADFHSLSLLARHASAQILEHQSVATHCHRGRSCKRLRIVPFEILRARLGVRVDGWLTHWGNLGCMAGS